MKMKAPLASRIEAVNHGLGLRSDIEPVNRRGEHQHIRLVKLRQNFFHAILLRAHTVVRKAVLTAETARNLLLTEVDEASFMSGFPRTAEKGLCQHFRIPLGSRTSVHHNDLHLFSSRPIFACACQTFSFANFNYSGYGHKGQIVVMRCFFITFGESVP